MGCFGCRSAQWWCTVIDLREDTRRVLLAVAAGRVARGPVGAGKPRYLVDGVDGVDDVLAALVAEDLVFVPVFGSSQPRLQPDGEWALTNFT
jgi:hypothetical protein